MDSIKVTYELRRHDSSRFHGWIIWECSDGMESVYFSQLPLWKPKQSLMTCTPKFYRLRPCYIGCITSKTKV